MGRAKLAGLELDADSEVSWSLVAGTRPNVQRFRVQAALARTLFARRKAHDATLEIQADEASGIRKATFAKLTIISLSPSVADARREVEVADRRWTWPRITVLRRYNMRRRAADTRRLRQEGIPEELQAVVPDFTFAPWSLYPRNSPSEPWTPDQVLRDILDLVVGSGGYRIEAGFSRSLPVESLELDDPAPQALDRVLALLPGTGIFVDYDGTVVVYDENSLGERKILAKGPPIAGPLLAGVVDQSLMRPEDVEVLFDREVELRLDSREEGAREVDRNARDLENVGPITDQTLVIAGRVKTMGSLETFDSLFTAWTNPPQGQPALSHSVLQERWLIPRLLDTYTRPRGASTPDPIWARRVMCALRNYRQLYRIQRHYADKILRIAPYRIGVLDQETGTRAAARVYANFCAIPTVLGLGQTSQDQNALLYNVTGYPTDGLLSSAKDATPAVVSIEDPDQMVLRVNYVLDSYGRQAQIVPSKCVGPDGTERSLPSGDPRKAGANGSGILVQWAKMAASHRIAIVLTCAPAAPNDERQLHSEIVTPSEAQDVLGRKIGACRGPRWQIRIGAAILPARQEWRDELATEFDKLFGVVPGAPTLPVPSNHEAVKALARAAAAVLYSGLLDRVEGSHVIALDGSIKPAGTAVGVTHSLEPDGTGLTTVAMAPPGLGKPDLFSLLPSSLRAQIKRLTTL